MWAQELLSTMLGAARVFSTVASGSTLLRTNSRINHASVGMKFTALTSSRCRLWERYVFVRWTPHAVIVTIMDNTDYIRVLFYSYCTTVIGWGVLLINVFVELCGQLSGLCLHED